MYQDQKDSKEYTMDDLEDIIREYSAKSQPEPEKADSAAGDTVRFDAVQSPLSSDTAPLGDIDADMRVYRPGKAKKSDTRPLPQMGKPSAKTGTFSVGKEETPPPREPIAFPRNPLQELRQKLVAGPERRYLELLEAGFGGHQAAIFLNVILFLAASATTLMYYQVSESRLRLLVFGQLLVLLLSALVGSRRLLEGVTDMLSGHFRLNGLLFVTFLACFADGLICLQGHRLPFGAVFSLQMLMAQWGKYQKRQTELSQLDTLRKASELTAVVKNPGFYKGMPGYQTRPGQPEDFMDHYRQTSGPEQLLSRCCLGAVVIAAVLAILCGILHGVQEGIQVFAAALLAAVPASTFIALERPAAILEKRMHKLGTVLCGWHGIGRLEKRGVYPLDHGDLFPQKHVKLNGVRFYGDYNPNTVVSYVAALTAADGGTLVDPFEKLRAGRNARKYRVQELTSYPNGIGGQIDGVSVLAGSMEFMENMGVELPDGAGIPHAVYGAIDQCLCAVFAVSYGRSKSTASGLRTLCGCRNVYPVLVDCDFVLTESFLQQKLGLDIHRMQFPDYVTRMDLEEKKPEPDAPAIALATRSGLAQKAYAVTGGTALRSAWRAGLFVHLLGGGLGLLAVAILSLVGGIWLMTPYNLLLYGCVWMIPGLLVAEWTRNI